MAGTAGNEAVSGNCYAEVSGRVWRALAVVAWIVVANIVASMLATAIGAAP
jgi:hypothetical protein